MENNFTQLCVWMGTIVGKRKVKQFEDFVLKEMGSRVKYDKEIKTLQGQGGKGGRNDVFFYVHSNDIPKFAVKRLSYGIRWWEDIQWDDRSIYPYKEISNYKNTWEDNDD